MAWRLKGKEVRNGDAGSAQKMRPERSAPVHCREHRGHGTLIPYDGLDVNPTLEVGMTTYRSPPTKC